MKSKKPIVSAVADVVVVVVAAAVELPIAEVSVVLHRSNLVKHMHFRIVVVVLAVGTKIVDEDEEIREASKGPSCLKIPKILLPSWQNPKSVQTSSSSSSSSVVASCLVEIHCTGHCSWEAYLGMY